MLKKIVSFVASLVLGASMCVCPGFADGEKNYDFDDTMDIAGFDTKVTAGIYVYPNNTESPRVISADEYGFNTTQLMVFNKDGRLIECGANIFVGGPQISVAVPAGGFLVALSYGSPKAALKCYSTAMEGAMLYNATMSVIFPVFGSYDQKTSKLRLCYDAPSEPSEDAVRFLFVGNSSTYFNGTPIKFKGLCQAAGIEVVTDYCTFGSAYLYEFADENHERGKKLRDMLSKNKYDYVVLHDAGGADYSDADPALDKILPLVEENGATPLLYMRYSSNSDPSKRINSAKKHHVTYTRIAAERDILCCPSAHSFLICTDKYPHINLYADDNSHHSKEGSYLIACTWLKTYLGVDPIGNSYTANMDSDTVAALQECAVSACNWEYVFPGDSHKKTIDGKEYYNHAFGKSYIPSGQTYSGEWSDTGTNGKPLGRLTDGLVALNGSDTEIGAYKGEITSVVVDLQNPELLKQFTTDLFGNGSWGIPDPETATVIFEISDDGKTFSQPEGELKREVSEEENWKKCIFTFTCPETVEARYVKVTYQLSGGAFCWASEISAYGEAREPEVPQESEPVSHEQQNQSSEPGSKNSSLLMWVCVGVSVAAILAALTVIVVKVFKK